MGQEEAASACVFGGLKLGPEGLQMLTWLHSVAGISLLTCTPCAPVNFGHVRYPVGNTDIINVRINLQHESKHQCY